MDLAPEPHRAKTFTAYAKLVEHYTPRKLSYDADTINAFLGTFTVLNASFQSDILMACPRRETTRGIMRQYMESRLTLTHSLPTNRGTTKRIEGPAVTDL